MSYVAAGVAAAGVGTSVLGGIMGGNSAAKAAQAQSEAAQRWINYVNKQQDTAVGMVKSPSAMAAYTQALGAQEQTVRRQEGLASSIEPSLAEAGKQTMQLLQGKSAPVLQQIQSQRDMQRKQMLDTLRQQMGPGAETSSAGQQAMQNFDMQTASLMNQTQQSYLDKVSGLSLGGMQTLGDTLSRVNSTLDTIQTQSPDAQAARLMAEFTNSQAGAQNASIEAAGAAGAKGMIQGQMITSLGNTATTLAGASLAGRFASPTAERATTPGQQKFNGQLMGSNDLTMPEVGSSFGQQPSNYSLGSAVGSSTSAGGMPMKKVGAGIPNGTNVGVPAFLSPSGAGYYNTPDGMNANLPWSHTGIANMFNFNSSQVAGQ